MIYQIKDGEKIPLSTNVAEPYDKYFTLTATIADNKVNLDVSSLFQAPYQPYQITLVIVTSSSTCSFSMIAYKNWNDSIYYSVLANKKDPAVATGDPVIESVTKDTIVYQVVGNITEVSNYHASAIKL